MQYLAYGREKEMTVDWRGYWVASPTPFTATGAINEELTRKLMGMYLQQGVHGIVVNGSTGEWCSQTVTERKHLARIAVNEVARRIPVIIGTSSYVPSECIELVTHAQEIGADGVLITPPPYYNLQEDEIYCFYKLINDNTKMPIMIYNWPRGIGVDMSEELLLELSLLSNVKAIKESSGDELKTYRVYEKLTAGSADVRFFARFIHPLGAGFLQNTGGDGNIDGGGLGARFAVAFYNAWWTKDITHMRLNSNAYANLSRKLINFDYSGKFASPISQLKACMRILGQPGGFVRPPLLEVSAQTTLNDLATVLTSSGITE